MLKNPFEDCVDFIKNKHGEESWITVYKSTHINQASESVGMYSALVTNEKSISALKNTSWDLTYGSGRPGFVINYVNSEKKVNYYSNEEEGFLRIVLNREFHGRMSDYVEILQEFRLFHNLYYLENEKKYIAFDEVGDQVDAVKICPDQVQIRRHYLSSFMAAKQMHLLLYFDITRKFIHNEKYSSQEANPNLIFSIFSDDYSFKNFNSFSRILGKKLVRCDRVELSGIWPFEVEKVYLDFIIGGDVDSPKKYTCNPKVLSNYFGDNRDAPSYLTSVFFKKEVMQKYYSSGEYSIGDGRLSRRGSWSLRFDNNAKDHVSVFLGDLGQDLPTKEQEYWKSFNIFADGKKISRTNFNRNFMGNFSDPENPEHEFKYFFNVFQLKWFEKNKWYLFLPLSINDRHFFWSIRSMLTNEQSEFDSQILALAKVVIDSLNTEELRKKTGISDPKIGSLNLLEKFLCDLGSQNLDKYISSLKSIQSIRSAGVAHRKGAQYEKIISKLKLNTNDFQTEFDNFLRDMVFFLKEIPLDTTN
jgi:hypothetical protein